MPLLLPILMFHEAALDILQRDMPALYQEVSTELICCHWEPDYKGMIKVYYDGWLVVGPRFRTELFNVKRYTISGIWREGKNIPIGEPFSQTYRKVSWLTKERYIGWLRHELAHVQQAGEREAQRVGAKVWLELGWR